MRKPTVWKNPLLIRYWIEFPRELTQRDTPWLPATVGVTAYSLDDALDIIHQYLCEYLRNLFAQHPLPPVVQVTENVDIATLLDKHRRPIRSGVSIWRGIWYPDTWYWDWRIRQ